MLSDLAWIVIGGLAMSAIAMVGGATTLLRPATLERLVMPLVAVAAGTLMGGAFLHMLPAALAELPALSCAVWTVAGFTAFLILEQFLHWHHSHSALPHEHRPVTWLVLIGDALHNFLGGIGVASTFLIDTRAGITAWLAAAAHEVPQELGDFAVLVHGGWSRRQALRWNVLSALTFPLGAVFAFAVSRRLDVAGLVAFGAGNFLYIAASDLVPEIKAQPRAGAAILNVALFATGVGLMFLLTRVF